MISEYNSTKIRVLSFISIIMVIFIHSVYLEGQNYPFSSGVQMFMAGTGMSLFSVPLFYAISGFLFFYNIKDISDCYPKIKRRIKTLLIPYIIWNLIFVLWYVALDIIPGISSYINSDITSEYQLSHPFIALYNLFIKPAGFHLWFLRDLIVFVSISPIIYWCIKKSPWFTFAVSFIGLGWLARFGITYFILGGIIAVHYDLNKVKSSLSSPIVCVCSIIYLMNCFIATANILDPEAIYRQYYMQLMSIIGLISIWGVYDIIAEGKNMSCNSTWSSILSYVFFIYLFHEPTFNIIKKLGLKIIGDGSSSIVILYLINPFIIIVVSIFVAKCLQRIMPNVYSVLVGGR